jgi:P27 family predicted phage terminase small subunit
MRGRKPKPTFLKLVQGNPGKRALNRDEPAAPPAIPKPPASLSRAAKREWKRSAQLLKDSGLLSHLDRNTFALYCQTWAQWIEAQEQIAQHGMLVRAPSGYPMQSPYIGIANGLAKKLIQMSAEFGLTPSSRSRIRLTDDKPVDALEEFLAHGTAPSSR